MSMLIAFIALISGLFLLVWSADKFVEGAALTARYAGMSPLLIGMVIIGFGTSAPELVVSVLAASQGNPGLALGNAYGSNIVNIGLILGLTALISPIAVSHQVLRRELPILLGITLLSGVLLLDFTISRGDATLLGLLFIVIMGGAIWSGLRRHPHENEKASDKPSGSIKIGLFWLFVGLLLLIAASRLVVWGAVTIAQQFGISDLVIGLTIVAIGTSLPELASSLVAIRKNQHDLALGNVIGSNFFNTLAVVAIASGIHPFEVEPALLFRDWTIMSGLTLLILLLCVHHVGQRRIPRWGGAILLTIFVLYTAYLLVTQF